MTEARKSYSISKYNTAVQKLLKDRIPRIWVKGMISQMQARGALVYFTLSEFAEDQEQPAATLPCYLFRREFDSLLLRIKSEVPDFEIREEMNVCVQLEADFYVPFGKFQPKIVDLDPLYTLGEWALTRKKILEKLTAEGLLTKQKSLSFPLLPLRIGLITAQGSAAHLDFITTLKSSGFPFVIEVFDARMQGKETERTVVEGIRSFQQENVDVLCLIRGGGAKTDLIYFDSELICREIAGAKIPVLTGIGHQVDESLADLVSFHKGITPTAVAEFLVECLVGEALRLKSFQERLLQGAESVLEEAARFEKNAQSSLLKFSQNPLREAKIRLRELQQRLQKQSKSTLRLERKGVEKFNDQLGLFWKLQRRRENETLHQILSQILRGTLRRIQRENEELEVNAHGLNMGQNKIQRYAGQEFEHFTQRLKEKWKAKFLFEQEGLAQRQKLVRSHDPSKNLERGYAIVRSKQTGKIVTFSDLKNDLEIETKMAQGSVVSRVIKLEKKSESESNL